MLLKNLAFARTFLIALSHSIQGCKDFFPPKMYLIEECFKQKSEEGLFSTFGVFLSQAKPGLQK